MSVNYEKIQKFSMQVLFLLLVCPFEVYEGFAQANEQDIEPFKPKIMSVDNDKLKGELHSGTSILVPPTPDYDSKREIENETENSEKFHKRMEAAYKLQDRRQNRRTKTSEIFRCSRPGLFALTFDDGPSYNGNTESVLDVLAERGVKATFFVTGYGYDSINLTTDARKQELLQRTHREGHQIASHTFTHDSLVLPGNRTKASIIQDIRNLANAVHDITGLHLTLLRGPYGHLNATVLDLIKEEFGYKVINWNINTMDWKYGDDIERSFKIYLRKMGNARVSRDSYIALHHDPAAGSGELAAKAIDYVRSKGFKFVTVGECIGMDSGIV